MLQFTFVLATNNTHKVDEILPQLPEGYVCLTASQAGIEGDLPETQFTLQDNALQKARYCYEITGLPSLADDTGLEVDSLGGAPGVYSARYAGFQRSAADNMAKLLANLGESENRKAQFRTVMAWVTPEGEKTFEGVVKGEITLFPKGAMGFGYDPVFKPDGHDKTFAEMDMEQKNSMSHRARALAGFVDHLKETVANTHTS
jgi:XTP/dITP diphosphohydrolase